MNEERGTVSVQTENIFPIIRKWLYSDRDIFLRELVSNAADAIAKLRRLSSIGETDLDARTAGDTLGAVVKDRDDLELVGEQLDEIVAGA